MLIPSDLGWLYKLLSLNFNAIKQSSPYQTQSSSTGDISQNVHLPSLTQTSQQGNVESLKWHRLFSCLCLPDGVGRNRGYTSSKIPRVQMKQKTVNLDCSFTIYLERQYNSPCRCDGEPCSWTPHFVCWILLHWTNKVFITTIGIFFPNSRKLFQHKIIQVELKIW